MTKSKAPKLPSVPHKHLHSRISFLYQAATYLANAQAQSTPPKAEELDGTTAGNSDSGHRDVQESTTSNERAAIKTSLSADPGGDSIHLLPAKSFQETALSRQMLSHLRAVSLKAQIRLSPIMKRSICKRCNALLVTGSTCHERVENLSRGGRKPWADVIVLNCNACGTEKRAPVVAIRQTKKTQRRKREVPQFGNDTSVPE